MSQEEFPAIDPGAFLLGMRRWATGVTIVTSRFGPTRHGMTVSSFTSLSVEPPLLMVSLERTARTHDLVLQANVFGVSILSAQQKEISERFAGRLNPDGDRFEGLATFELSTGSPFIEGALASFDCRVVSMLEVGTHTLFVGKVVGVQIDTDRIDPLLYFNRGYWHLQVDG